MDLSSILPLLLNKNGDNNQMSSILSAMNGNNGKNGGGLDPAAIIDMMNNRNNGEKKSAQNTQNDNTQNNGGNNNMSAMFDMLKNKTGGNSSSSALDMVNLMSTLNKNNRRAAQGLKPVKSIVPNDIMGILVKMLG